MRRAPARRRLHGARGGRPRCRARETLDGRALRRGASGGPP
ncbi:hypothetical protein BMAPRL20_A0665 [Burkholderia mallei PRL-20]|nr:hypothetical protein BMAPRL20_A0665 [Burkholderia mallei PRL-20]